VRDSTPVLPHVMQPRVRVAKKHVLAQGRG